MYDYSVAVALFDYLPVMLSGLGLWLLARAVAAHGAAMGRVAFGAALLIVGGGLCKASWKLIAALSGHDIDWLENLLFIGMAPGFVLLSYCLFHTRRGSAFTLSRPLFWLCFTLGGAGASALFCPHPRGWFFWLLAVTTAADAALIVNATIVAFGAGRRGAATLFIYNFFATLSLSSLARLPPTEATAWLQEALNLSSQAAFAYGAWQISGDLRARPERCDSGSKTNGGNR